MVDKDIVIKQSELVETGQNIKATKQGTLLILVIDTSTEIGLSTSGKMMGVASTGGFTAIPGGLKGNIYIGKKA